MVYVISEGPAGPCKIGTSTNPTMRLGQCQTGNPRRLTLEAQVLVPFPDRWERAVHGRLTSKHLGFEWFDVSPAEAIAAIESVGDIFGDDKSIRRYRKLTDMEVRAIRQAFAAGRKANLIADFFSVSEASVHMIARKIRKSSVPDGGAVSDWSMIKETLLDRIHPLSHRRKPQPI